MPVRADTDLLVTAVAQLTTLTPGTLVLEIDRRGGLLYVHALGVRDQDGADSRRDDTRAVDRRVMAALAARTGPGRPAATCIRSPGGPLTVALNLALGILVASGLLILVRMLRGPAALDRIVALDVLASVIIAGTTVHMALWHDPTPLPVLVVLALLAFIGSVTAAHLVERREGMR